MRYYWEVYKRLIKINFAAWVVYRGNFLNNLIGDTVWGVFHIVSILVLTSSVSSVYGWSKNELIILTASFSVLWGFFHLFFARNFEEMAEIINLGNLDTYLLKPLDSQFFLSFYYVNFSGFIRTIIGLAVLFYVVLVNKFQISLVNIFNYLILTACGLILIYSVWFLLASVIIWFPRLTNLVYFLFTISGISRYPPETLKQFNTFTFIFLLPLVIFVSTPTKALLNKPVFGNSLILLALTVIFLVASRKFWKFALRYYTSASS